VVSVAAGLTVVALTVGVNVLTGGLVGVVVFGCGLAQAANTRVSAMKRMRGWEAVISFG
jgi:hypothetical protein